jgi:L-malate glycosyltransferase
MGATLHQLVHTLSYGDAISTEVLALQEALHGLGYRSEIFALHEHPNYRGRTHQIEKLYDEKDASVILHYSLGSVLNQVYADWERGGKILIYHNITPPHWYRSINQRVASDIEQGIKELPSLCAISDAIWADSHFNAKELQGFGVNEVQVLDLLVSSSRWSRARNESLYSSIANHAGCQVLHVGRLAPNKCVEDIIKSFYFLLKYIDPMSRLRLVGIDTDTEMYSFSLRELADRLGIGHAVEFTGALSDEEVRALYEASDVYVCMSEHEGFCLPLIEAMHFELPVVAFSAAAVPETLGDAGVLVYEKRHAEIAQLLALVCRDAEIRCDLITKGRAQVARYSASAFSKRIDVLVSGFLNTHGLTGA